MKQCGWKAQRAAGGAILAGLAAAALGGWFADHLGRAVDPDESRDAALRQPLDDDQGEAAGEGRPAASGALGAYRWRLLLDGDVQGRIPADAMQRALRERHRLALRGRLAAAGALDGAWTFRGPNNVGGRTRALLTDPRDGRHLWAGSVGGGIFVSHDGGKSWSPLDDGFPNLAVCSLARDPADPDTVWVGTGEGYYNSDAVRGAGVFVTRDGGASFSAVPQSETWGPINRIAVSPTDSRLVLVASGRGVYRTADGGATWSQRTTFRALQVTWNPQAPGEALLSEEGTRSAQRILLSTDGGVTWSSAGGFDVKNDWLARIELAYAPSDGNVAYANQDGAFWRSTDGGRNWSPAGDSGEGSWYNNAIWVSPTDPNLVLVGGFAVRRSTSGGQSFVPISDGYLLTQQVHPDVHVIVHDSGYDGLKNRRVYVGSDGGFFVTENVAAVTTKKGWTSLNAGYATTQFYNAAGDQASNVLIGGTQDNGTLRVDKLPKALLTFGGDGGFVEVDRQSPKYVYGEYIGLQYLFRSKDGGKKIDSFLHGRLPEAGKGNFIAPFTLDPSDGNVMYAGAQHLWRSDNVRTGKPPSWRAVRTPLFTASGSAINVASIAVSPLDRNLVWVGHNDGQVWLTRDAQSADPSWEAIDDNRSRNPLPGRFPTRIVASLADPDVAWVSFSQFVTGNVWRTDDGGATWRDASGTGAGRLPAAPVLALAQHPDNPEWLYAGSEVGVFASEDGGDSWSTVNQGPGSVAVFDLRFLVGSHTLLAATHGRGLWTIAVP